jgi:hypothetical protein
LPRASALNCATDGLTEVRQQIVDRHPFGVGKHILGSQVFDYWKDPDGFMLEHFTDGDLFNESFGSHKRSPEELVGMRWGPDGMPGQ